MYSTKVFTYTPRRQVVVLSGSSERKYMPEYSSPLSLHRGVDTKLQYQFINQQQKPVDVTGKTIKFRVISGDGNKILLEKALEPELPVTGIMNVIVTAAEIENISTQKAFYSLEIPSGQFAFPVYIDQSQGARGDINIVNSILPSFVPSYSVSIPNDQAFPNNSSGQTSYVYYSSVVETNENSILTIQIGYTEYTGNVVVQGSTVVDSEWYDITSNTYANTSVTSGHTITGFHPFVRIKFDSESGNVDTVLVR